MIFVFFFLKNLTTCILYVISVYFIMDFLLAVNGTKIFVICNNRVSIHTVKAYYSGYPVRRLRNEAAGGFICAIYTNSVTLKFILNLINILIKCTL